MPLPDGDATRDEIITILARAAIDSAYIDRLIADPVAAAQEIFPTVTLSNDRVVGIQGGIDSTGSTLVTIEPDLRRVEAYGMTALDATTWSEGYIYPPDPSWSSPFSTASTLSAFSTSLALSVTLASKKPTPSVTNGPVICR